MRKQPYWNLLPDEKPRGMPGKVIIPYLVFRMPNELLHVASFGLPLRHLYVKGYNGFYCMFTLTEIETVMIG